MIDMHALDTLVKETFSLWDLGWVTFNWRNYTYDHTQRVRGLAMNLCAKEGGNQLIAELSALLHDITKSYDGEYILDAEGKRVVDADGYWRNAMRPPQRQNEITALYDNLQLADKLHNDSGAAIAYALLCRRGLDEPLCARVAQTIRDHLHPAEGAPIESRCLYDADTIDANIGLPAFVRNIYINLHFYETRNPGVRLPGFSVHLPTGKANDPHPEKNTALLDYLQPYITDKLPTWAMGKQCDFIPRLLTRAGQELASARLERLITIFQQMGRELKDLGYNGQHGCLSVLLHYMSHQDDPSIAAETGYLADEWLGKDTATQEARQLVEHLKQEMAGTA